MSAAAAEAAAPKNGGKKKLLIILAAAVLLVGGGGTGALVFIKKRQAAAEAAAEEGDDAAAAEAHPAKAAAHDEHRTPPTFVPLDPFVINLADHDADRYAQIGITLQVPDAHAGDDINNYKPAIRNNILLLLAHKTSEELAGREGKEKLAAEIRRESLRAMGYELPEEDEAATAKDGAASGAAEAAPRKKAKKAKAPENLPITAVVFSSFIIQ